jgi:hypothetical protein
MYNYNFDWQDNEGYKEIENSRKTSNDEQSNKTNNKKLLDEKMVEH